MADQREIKEKIAQILQQKGVDPEAVCLSLCSDVGAKGELCDCYVFLTDSDFVVLSVREKLKSARGPFLFSRRPLHSDMEPVDFSVLSREKAEKLFTEDSINGGRLCVQLREGDALVLAGYTMQKKAAVRDFCGEGNRLLKGESLPPKKKRDKQEEGHCPKCHSRYPDPEVRLCPKCIPKTKLFTRLFPFFKKYRVGIALTVLMLVLGNLLSLFVPFLSNTLLYDRVLRPQDPWYGFLGALVVAIVGTHLVMALFDHLNSVVSSRISANVIYDLKKTIFGNLQRLSMSFFTGRQTGSLMTQVNSDAETLYWFFCDGVPYFITNMIKLLGVCVTMLILEWRLALAILVPLPLMIWGYRVVMRGFSRLHAKHYAKSRRFNSTVSDVLTGFRVVKAFAKEASEVDKFDRKSKGFSDALLSLTLRSNTVFPIVNLITTFVGLLIWALGGWLVVRHSVTGGSEGISYSTLLLFITYLSYISGPVTFLGEFLGQLSNAANSMRRLFEVIDTVPDVREAEHPVEKEKLMGDIVFDRVGFSYEPGRKTLEDISFVLPHGQTLGIVGHTGAGKSTIANLLTRLYDAGEGEITIDGVPLQNYSLDTLHRNVAIVSQETYLFRGSLMDNIRYARPEATKEEVIAAAKAAGAHDFIMKMPAAYHTVVGDKTRLSGGERQRISIARAILKQPQILILDEATASMDTKTERLIQESLDRITQGRTTVIIAHRLSTLKNADRLIVIKDGTMIEEGTHSELMKQKGEYHKLYMLQLEALKTIAVG